MQLEKPQKKHLNELLEQAQKTYAEGNHEKSSEYIAEILREDPNIATAWHLAALIMFQQRNFEKTSEFIKRALIEEPKNIEYNIILAQTLRAEGKLIPARNNLLKTLEIQPGNLDCLAELAQVELERNEIDNSYAYLKHYTEIDPTNAMIFNNLGCIAIMSGAINTATDHFKQAIQLDPTFADAHNNLGNIYLRQDNLPAAESCYQQALELNPDYADAHNNMGNVCKLRNEFDNAYDTYNKVLTIDPNHTQANNNIGLLNIHKGNWQEAEHFLNNAVALAPKNFEARHNLGLCLYHQEKFAAAKDEFIAAVAINDSKWDSFFYLGKIEGIFGNSKKELQYFKEAARKDNNNTDDKVNLLYHIGKCYQQAKDYSMATSYYQKILELNPQHAPCACSYYFTKLCQYDWQSLDVEAKKISSMLQSYKHEDFTISPFESLALPLSHDEHRIIAEQEATKIITQAPSYKKGIHPKHRQTKIGYLSPDFNCHPVGLQLSDILPHHNREKFHITAYNLVPNTQNQITQLITSNCDEFIDLFDLTTKAAAQKINADETDILVDLAGYTNHTNLAILALQPAPIQCHWLGYAASLHAPFIQYFISHETIVTTEIREQFSEAIAYLPDTAFVIEPTTKIPSCTREEFNLPADQFIYCCFAQPYRIDMQTFKIWMTILQQTPNSILWLYAWNNEQQENLSNMAKQMAIDPNRLYFSDQFVLTSRWHHQLADVWLDPLHITSATGTLLSLCADLPSVSFAGNTAQARSSASILTCANLKTLVANTHEDYIQTAVALYKNPENLAAIKKKIAAEKAAMPIFNPRQFTTSLEIAFKQMLTNYHNKQPLSDLYV